MKYVLMCALVVTMVAAPVVSAMPHDQAHSSAAASQLLKKAKEVATLHLGAYGEEIVAEATAHLGSTLFNKIGAVVDQAVNTYGKSAVIPGGSSKHFSYDAITFSTFDIGAIDFTFAAPNKVTFDIQNLNIVIPDTGFEVFDKILFIKVHCRGKFSAKVEGTSIKVTLTLDQLNEKLHVSAASADVNFGVLTISHRMDHFLCRVANSIIQLLIGNINDLITKFIREKLPADIGPIVQQLLDKEFGKIPLTLWTAPVVNSAGIDIGAVLLKYPTSAAARPVPERAVAASRFLRSSKPAKGSLLQMLSLQDKTPLLPISSSAVIGDSTDRDVNLIVTAPNVNKALDIYNKEGKLGLNVLAKQNTSVFKTLLPDAYQRCPNCRLYFQVSMPQSSPTVNLRQNGNITVAGDKIHIAVKAINSNDPTDPPAPSTQVDLFTLEINGTIEVINIRPTGTYDCTLLFEVGVPVFTLWVDTSSVGPMPLVPDLSALLRFLIQDVVVPDFNKQFKGLVFPFALIRNVLAQVSQDQVNVGLNLVL